MWLHKIPNPSPRAGWTGVSIDELLSELREGLQFTRAAQFAAERDTFFRAQEKAVEVCKSVERNLIASCHLLSDAEQERVMSGLQHLEEELAGIRKQPRVWS